MATGLFYSKGHLVVVGGQTGQVFIYDTKTGRLSDKATSSAPLLT